MAEVSKSRTAWELAHNLTRQGYITETDRDTLLDGLEDLQKELRWRRTRDDVIVQAQRYLHPWQYIHLRRSEQEAKE